MAKAFGLPQGGGALVGDVSANSPAAKAGIERGDVILELNGQKINSPDDLSVRVSEMPPGTVAHLKVFRNAQTRDVNVTLGEFPANPEAAQGQGAHQPSELQGLQVENLTPDIARQLGIRASQTGVVVTAVDPSSQAAAAGIQTGDLIQEVNHTRINNVTEYERAIAAAGKNAVLLLINRQGTTHFVIVQPQ